MQSKLLSIPKGAKYIGCSILTMRAYIQDKKIPSYAIGKSYKNMRGKESIRKKLKVSDLDEYLAKLTKS